MQRIFIFFFSIFLSAAAFAQTDISTETLIVEGNCGMCKKRIEAAAYVKGVKRTEWDKTSRELKVVYRPSKTNIEAIARAIAEAGHASEVAEANEQSYSKLPKCCQYKTNTCND